MTTPIKVTLVKAKDCVNSVSFKATDKNAVVQSVYINRPASNNWKSVTITVEGE